MHFKLTGQSRWEVYMCIISDDEHFNLLKMMYYIISNNNSTVQRKGIYFSLEQKLKNWNM